MESASTQEASSFSPPPRMYDVFLSFRGEDTRKGFTDHLHAALNQKGIIVFRDAEKLERGEYISEKLLKGIQESEYAIVVISENYMFSKWCLTELTKIMECKREKRLIVFPVFYHVDPSNIRKQKGIFATAFDRHIEVPKVEKELWSIALEEVGNLAGWHVHDRHESIVIEEICGAIVDGVQRNLSNIFLDFVGIEKQVKELMSSLCIGQDDIGFIGICGMGGIGKTTLATIIYDMVSSHFEGSCFIDNIREKSSNMVGLQKELISEVINVKHTESWNSLQVNKVLMNKVREKKVLIVLDDVDKEIQLKALARSHDWFGPGSRVLITSRDSHLLKRYVDKIYEVKVLSDDDALQLFSLKAFKNQYPNENYVELSKDIINYAKGLPLALEVFGSFLFDRTMDVWNDARDRLKANPNSEILDKLEISFDGLEDLQKMLFLDIACFFNKDDIHNVIYKLEGLGHYSKIDIEVLKDKSLIKIIEGKFQMHDLLAKMGQRIVYRESPNEPGRRSRLWCHEDIIHVLKNNTGTDEIKGIILRLPLPKLMKFNFETFSKMKMLKMLVICPENFYRYKACDDEILKDLHMVEWNGDPSKLMLSNELRVMEWWGYPLQSLPTNFYPDNLVELKMPRSCIKILWDASKSFDELKHIDLGYSQDLIKMPEFNEVPNLEKFEASGIRIATRKLLSLSTIPKKLKVFRIGDSYSNPINLKLPKSLSFLRSLVELELSYCNMSDGSLPADIGSLSSLKRLDLSGNKFLTIPESISRLLKLQCLWLKDCCTLQALPSNLPLALREMNLVNCPSLYTCHDSMDVFTSSGRLVTSDLTIVAYYFGYDGNFYKALHVDQQSSLFDSNYHYISKAIAWGPTLGSEIPEWFTKKSTSLLDVSGTVQCCLDIHMKNYSVTHFGAVDSSHYHNPEDNSFEFNWGCALFIVYEVLGPDSFPILVCELQDKEDGLRVPFYLRFPEVSPVGSNGAWVFINGMCFPRASSDLEYSITVKGMNVEVKAFGARLVPGPGGYCDFHPWSDRLRFCELFTEISAHGWDLESVRNAFSFRKMFVIGPMLE